MIDHKKRFAILEATCKVANCHYPEYRLAVELLCGAEGYWCPDYRPFFQRVKDSWQLFRRKRQFIPVSAP